MQSTDIKLGPDAVGNVKELLCPRGSPLILWGAVGTVLLPCAVQCNRGLTLLETRKLVFEHGPKEERGKKKKKDIKKVLNKVQETP